MTAADFVPTGADLDGLRRAADGCRGCHLYENATQTVFGRGPVSARVVVVGEQPGDVEDRRGEPFVGPAGKLLDRAVAEAGLDPSQIYTTNAVEHLPFGRFLCFTCTHAERHAAPLARRCALFFGACV